MKIIIEEKEGIAALAIGRMSIADTVDNESVRVVVPLFIGSNQFVINGTLNIIENIFHWSSSNEEELAPYLEGYDIDIESAIENR